MSTSGMHRRPFEGRHLVSSVLNVVSINDTRFFFLRKSLFKKLLPFSVIYSVCNIEEKKTLIFHIILHA